MNRKTTWLLASLLGMTTIEAQSAETPQTPQALSQQPGEFNFEVHHLMS